MLPFDRHVLLICVLCRFLALCTFDRGVQTVDPPKRSDRRARSPSPEPGFTCVTPDDRESCFCLFLRLPSGSQLCQSKNSCAEIEAAGMEDSGGCLQCLAGDSRCRMSYFRTVCVKSPSFVHEMQRVRIKSAGLFLAAGCRSCYLQ